MDNAGRRRRTCCHGPCYWNTFGYDEFGTVFTSGHDDRSFVAGEIVFYTGLASMVGSIPLFVASARNKRKSMAISTYFKIERYVAIQNNGFSNQLYPAISLHMNL